MILNLAWLISEQSLCAYWRKSDI